VLLEGGGIYSKGLAGFPARLPPVDGQTASRRCGEDVLAGQSVDERSESKF
jgi:hypothetical protein